MLTKKKCFALILLLLLTVCLLTACGTKDSSPSPDPAAPDVPQPEAQPDDTPEETVPEESVLSIEFDPKTYPDPGSDDVINALAYASSTSDKPVQVTVRYRVFDAEGNAIKAYDLSRGRELDQFETFLFIPAGAEDLPVAFSLHSGLRFSFESGEEMPEISRVEFETVDTQEVDFDDLADHFTVGDPQTDNYNITIPVGFDQEIADNYRSIYADYTLLGYKDGDVIAVYCKNDFPYGTSSYSVSYAVENSGSSISAYHYIYGVQADEWKLHLGCIAGE